MPMYLIMNQGDPFMLMNDKEKAIDQVLITAAENQEDDVLDYDIIEIEVGKAIDQEKKVSIPGQEDQY